MLCVFLNLWMEETDFSCPSASKVPLYRTYMLCEILTLSFLFFHKPSPY